MVARAVRLALAWAAGALLAACGTPQPPSPPVAEPDPPAPSTSVVVTEDPQLQAFVREQRDRAARSEGQGRWSDAAAAWDLVQLLRPEDGRAAARAAAARQRAQREADARLSAADAARQRGDVEGAVRSYLEALALDPDRRHAADALRQLEAEREHRRLAARNGRLGALARRPGDDGMAASAADADAARRYSAAREHASMLVSQGDFDAAIQVMREALPAKADARSRSQLADLYVQKAESLRRTNPQAARAAVDAALALDRRHAAARALQRQLPTQASGPAAPTTRR